MWRVFGLIYFDDKDIFLDNKNKKINKAGIQEMLKANKIGVCETAREVIRTKDNASDKILQIVTPINFSEILPMVPLCKDICTTGEKSRLGDFISDRDSSTQNG